MAKNKLSKLITSTGSNAISPAPYKPSAADKARERRYQAEDNLRTITRAQEIMRNGVAMRDVRTLAREQMKTLQTVTKKRKP